jgi:hypothetical protein
MRAVFLGFPPNFAGEVRVFVSKNGKRPAHEAGTIQANTQIVAMLTATEGSGR